jgi:hypothetical protein
MNDGWIGNWSPGIGDPTIGGWLTVVLYACTAWMSLRVLQRRHQLKASMSNNESMVWRMMVFGLIALGLNKQLDLQSALTELGRMLAFEQGWYGNRRQVQEAFIVALCIAGLTVLAAMTLLVWGSPKATLWACAGASGLLVFVALRALSFHRLDEMLGWRIAGLALNWILEIGSLLVIGWSAFRRTRVRA